MNRLVTLVLVVLYFSGCKVNERSLAERVIDVSSFGISGDDTRNDGKRISEMFAFYTSKGSDESSFEFHFPSGVYQIETTVKVPSNVSIIGHGDVVFQRMRLGKYHMFEMNGVVGSRMKGVRVRGLRSTVRHVPESNHSYSYGIFIRNSSNVSISGVNISETINTGMRLSGTSYVTIDSCTFENIGLPTSEAVASGMKYAYDGILITGTKALATSNTNIINCTFERIGDRQANDDGDGIQLSKNDLIENTTIDQCVFRSCSRRAVKIQSGRKYVIANSKFYDCGRALGIPMSSSVSDVVFTKNSVENCSQGIQLNSSKDHCLQGIKIANNNFAKTSNVIYTAGKSRLCAYADFKEADKSTWSLFEGNVVDQNSDFLMLGIFSGFLLKSNTFRNVNAKQLRNNIEKPFTFRVTSSDVIFEKNQFDGEKNTSLLIEKRKGVQNIIVKQEKF